MRQRRGVTLIAVLWIIVAASAFALAAHASARQAVNGAKNRSAIIRARWLATACLEEVRAQIASTLVHQTTTSTLSVVLATEEAWRTLDRQVRLRTDSAADCTVSIEPAGALLNANTADEQTLRRLFIAAGVSAPQADTMVDALLDWRDPDDLPREFGAEQAWYSGVQRRLPRNGPLQDRRELSLVMGFDNRPDIRQFLDVEEGRIVLGSASPQLLAALPGFTTETISRLVELRSRNTLRPDLVALGSSLSPGSRDLLLAHYSDLARLTTFDPDAWIVRSTAASGHPAIHYSVEMRLVRAGDRAAVVRRRTWLE